MDGDNNNPVTSLGDQGSKELDTMISAPPAQDGAGSGAGENISAKSDAEGAKPTKSADGGGQQPAGQQPTAAQTQADIIRATAEAVASAHARASQQTAAQPAAPKELSPEEFNKKFNVTRANEELVGIILGNDPKKASAALDQYGQNLVKQAVLMALEIADANLGKYRSEVQPHIESWRSHQQQQAAVAAEQRFFKFAPDLANERDLVLELKDAFITRVRDGQVRFNTEQEAFTAVANAARSILKKVNPNWKPSSGSSQTQMGGQQTDRRMSMASSTGRSGTPQATAKSDVDLIFGQDAV